MLTRQQNEFKIKLKELEDSLLSRLSSAGGNFLGDTALVENLETTKLTAQDIEKKVKIVIYSVPVSYYYFHRWLRRYSLRRRSMRPERTTDQPLPEPLSSTSS